jgi:putative hydrolase of the HAD superfamily
MKIRAVAFDIDGTLYPNRCLYIRSVPFFLKNINLVKHFRLMRKDVRKVRPVNSLLKEQSRLLAERMGINNSEAESLLVNKIYTDWQLSFKNMKPYPYVRQVLEELKKEGLRLAVLSDFPAEQKLDYLGLKQYFEVFISSEDSNYLKPNPEGFMLLAEKLKLKPDEILYIGNNYKYDIMGAVNAGLPAAFIGGRRGEQALYAFRFSSYREFMEKFHDFAAR